MSGFMWFLCRFNLYVYLFPTPPPSQSWKEEDDDEEEKRQRGPELLSCRNRHPPAFIPNEYNIVVCKFNHSPSTEFVSILLVFCPGLGYQGFGRFHTDKKTKTNKRTVD